MCERPNDDLLAAAKALAKVLPDVVLESLRSEWGHTNVAVITHWRDEVLRRVSEEAKVGFTP
jgi:hypothetical protein